MSLSRLLPKAAENVNNDKVNEILYLCLAEWGWSYDRFLETPIPILFRLWKANAKIQKKKKAKK